MSNNNVTRRTFMQSTAAAAAAASVVTGSIGQEAVVAPKKSGEKLRFAMIGCGGQANRHYGWAKAEKIVAVCDPDKGSLAGKVKQYKAKGYTDYRELFKEMGDKIDAVVVATPDHSHFPSAMRALKLGKAVYCEKPLAWSFWECQQLASEAAKQKVATQMGNQGMAGPGWRLCDSYIKGGVIGDVTEVHTWTNRPVWPQGITKPEGQEDDPAKDNLDWDSWIGPAEMRPYISAFTKEYKAKYGRKAWKKHVYQDFVWRGWLDFGAGALGDMACHTMNAMFKVLEPGYPIEVELMASKGANKDTYPDSETIRWSFPKTDKRPAFTAFWYDGPGSDKAVPIPDAYEKGRKLPRTGTMFVGTKGVLQVTGDYNGTVMLVPEDARRDFGDPRKKLKATVPPNRGGHYGEFLAAAKGDRPWDSTLSNFGYAGPMTAVIILGIISQRVGAKLTFDPATLKFTGPKCEAANKLLRRVERDGWEA